MTWFIPFLIIIAAICIISFLLMLFIIIFAPTEEEMKIYEELSD